jgi:hypothetical protein
MSKKAVEIIKSKMSKEEIAQLVENAKLKPSSRVLYSFAMARGYDVERIDDIHDLLCCFSGNLELNDRRKWLEIYNRFTITELFTPIDIAEFR